jgi:hypothetical protein
MLKMQVTGIAQVAKTLKGIDNDIVKQARKDLRTGAKPVADAVKNNIPTQAPLRGMVHNGRTAWQPAGVKVTVKTNFTKKAERKGTSLVSIVAGAQGKNSQGAASFQIADIAGRKRSSGRSDSIKPYPYKGGMRTHRKNGQGRAMIRALNAQGRASRYVYPAALRELPFVQDVVRGTIKKLMNDYNRKLKG